MPRSPVQPIATLVLALALAVPAQAAGPPARGGESKPEWKGMQGSFEVQVLPTGSVLWLATNTRWACSAYPSRAKWFIADAKPAPRVGKGRRLVASDSYDRGRWTLRFSADWGTVSGTFHAAANGCRTRQVHISGRRVQPARTWVFGPFAGTTSQGLPLSLTSAWAVRYGRVEFEVRSASVGVQLACDDGTTIERTLRASGFQYVSADGTLMADVSESGKQPVPDGEVGGSIDGALSGDQVTGTVYAERSGEPRCSTYDPKGPGITFSARAGG